MDIHATEEQQLAAIKQWWKANGTSIITGVVLGFAALFATKAWIAWQQQKARNASDIYVAMSAALAGGNAAQVAASADLLMTKYEGSTYAAFAALALAKTHIEVSDLAAAATQLQWVIDHGKEAFVRDVARLRLARVRLAQGQADAALALLDQGSHGTAGEAQYLELRGDAELARGDRAAAATAYQRAIDATAADAPGLALLKMKYQDVAPATVASASAEHAATTDGAETAAGVAQ
jgi:predicted negative regulator of RcsB-dependent stress response